MAEQTKYEKIFSDYHRGMYVVQAQEQILHTNPVIGLFPKQEVDTKDITVLEEQPIDKYADKLPKGKRLSKGATARKFTGELIQPKGFKMVKHAIEYTIAQEDMENSYYNLSNEVASMSWILGKDMTTTIFDTAKKYAKEVTDTNIGGDWDTVDYDHILNDIVYMKKQLRDQNINKIDNFIYGDEAITKLASKSQVESTRYEFQKEGFYVDDTMRISGANHFWGGQDLEDGEVIGFNYNAPPMRIYYKRPSNPKVRNIPAIRGYEEVSPCINMLMYDDSETNDEPVVTIKMSCTLGAFPIAKGNRMIRIPNILSQ